MCTSQEATPPSKPSSTPRVPEQVQHVLRDVAQVVHAVAVALQAAAPAPPSGAAGRRMCSQSSSTPCTSKARPARAIEGTEFESLKDLLEGPSAIAISKSEATTPASIICKFAKINDKLEVKGGVVEGAFYDAKGVEVLSTIPSREELLAKFLGSIQSPITNFARVIKQIAEKQEA